MTMTDHELYSQAARILKPLAQWKHRCHEASLNLVKYGVGTRVARGFCPGVGSQHSWVVVGDNCYDKDATIIDPTLWSYLPKVKRIFVGTAIAYGHSPHGSGSIWDYGKPVCGNGKVVHLTPKAKLSRAALAFLELVEPLDHQGWAYLSSFPVEGWPAGEILAAMDDTKELSALVPIDRLGMLTDRNPGGLYLP